MSRNNYFARAGVLFFVLGTSAGVSQHCERLKASVTYSQEKAPRDLSGVLPVVVERVNRELEGVVDVEVEWTGGDLHGRVGDHTVKCKVTRLASAVVDASDEDDSTAAAARKQLEVTQDAQGRQVVVQCFQVPFTIQDTNECRLPAVHPMRHRCHESSQCINTIGSYECLCPRLGTTGEVEMARQLGDDSFWKEVANQKDRTPWELSLPLANKSSCPSKASTHDCCPAFAQSRDGKLCRSAFRCPIDPCGPSASTSKKTLHTCAASATCMRKDNPMESTNYICQCPPGLMGNGHTCRSGIDLPPQPKVMFDGITPTEETIKNDMYCDCSKPEVDACQGFPPCKGNHEMCIVSSGNKPVCGCKPGFVNNNDGYGCVDERTPVLKLRHDPHGDKTLRLKQGDVYTEYAVDIVDENAEEYMRSLRITYSAPLPPGCLTQIGEFHVNYTVATPWTSPPYVRVTRRVIIEDIDECSLDVSRYQETCPSLIPRCDSEAGATCVNTIGSYTCECPKYTSGDGFRKGLTFPRKEVPNGYLGGTSCTDTSRPTIKLLGPNPKVFKVCKCGGLAGIMSNNSDRSSEVEAICSSQRSLYDGQLKAMVRSTSGAELCATRGKEKPKSTECFTATDITYKGSADLTPKVKVGEPVQKTDLLWSVPYNVVDDAGNEALTVWRDVVVEEVNLSDLEHRVQTDYMSDKDQAIELAVEKAVREERAKWERELRVPPAKAKQTVKECPACPDCECAVGQTAAFDQARCDTYCDDKIAALGGICTADRSSSPATTMWDFWASIFPSSLLVAVLSVIAVFVALHALRFVATLVFNPTAFIYGRDTYDEYGAIQRERAMQDAVSYHHASPQLNRSSHRTAQIDPLYTRNTRSDMGAGGGLFSPPENRYDPGPQSSPFYSPTTGNTPGSARQGARLTDDDIYADASDIITPNLNGDFRQRRAL